MYAANSYVTMMKNRQEIRRKGALRGLIILILAFGIGCIVMNVAVTGVGQGGLLLAGGPEMMMPKGDNYSSVSSGDTNIASMENSLNEVGVEGNGKEGNRVGKNEIRESEADNYESGRFEEGEYAQKDVLLPEEDGIDVIVIDPGHGGEDEGCKGGNIQEKDINLQLALALRDKLKSMGYEVVMTRSDDTYVALEDRVLIANEARGDVFVSIHQNAYEGVEASGIETWYSSTASGKDNSRLARLLHDKLIAYTEAEDRGQQENDELKVIRETNMPACLVETGFLSNKKERTLLTDAEYQGKIIEALADGIELYFHPKTMYLTFDDGPSAENTNAILDILKEKNIKATFFVIGENVEKHPEVAKRIVEEGHTIGIHCYNHAYDNLYKSVDSYVADFEKAYNVVYETTGVEVELFRFPGGSINAYNKRVYQDIIVEMTERGFSYYDWNASLEDAVKKSEPKQLLKNAKESTLGRKKIIMLAHDVVDNTVLCLEELIEQFPEYRMEPLTTEVEPIQF